MKSNKIFPVDIPLIDIGYKYNYQKALRFNATEGARSTDPGGPYLSHFPDNYSNVYIRPVVFPRVFVSYLNAYNEIDNHNKICQSGLEQYRVTHSGYFRLKTTVELGIRITDGKLLLCNGISDLSREINFNEVIKLQDSL